MKWNESGKFFESESITKEIKGNPLEKALTPAPYADTYFTLTGDLFGRHFEVEQTITSDFYTAVALQVEADSVIINESKQLESGEFSAPLDVRFTAYANEPVANSFTWTITSADSTKTPVIYRTDEVEHSFDREGTYNVELRVLDRTGVCETILNTHQIKISNFYLDAPNVFSPGASPGINDEFKILYRSIISFKGWIFNRWGNEMFYWTNPDLGWDGKKGGKYVPPGVYFYVLEAKGSDGKLHKKTGSISILRSKTERNEIIE